MKHKDNPRDQSSHHSLQWDSYLTQIDLPFIVGEEGSGKEKPDPISKGALKAGSY